MTMSIGDVIKNLTTGYQQFDKSAQQLDQARNDLDSQIQNNLQNWEGNAPQAFFDTKEKIGTFTDDTIQACNDTSKAIQAYIQALQTASSQQAPVGGSSEVWWLMGPFELLLYSTGPGSTTPNAAGQQVINNLSTAEDTLRQAFDNITSQAKSVPEPSQYIQDTSDLPSLDNTSSSSSSNNNNSSSGPGGPIVAGGTGGPGTTNPTAGGTGASGTTAPTPGGTGGQPTTDPTAGGPGGPGTTNPTAGGTGAPPTTDPTAGELGGPGTTTPAAAGLGGLPPTSPTTAGTPPDPTAGLGGLPAAAAAGLGGLPPTSPTTAGTSPDPTVGGAGAPLPTAPTTGGTGAPPPTAPTTGGTGAPPPTGGPGGPTTPGSTPPTPPIPNNKLDLDALRATPEGLEALKTQQDNRVDIIKGQPGKGSSYNPKTKTLTLDPTDPDMNGTFVEKMAEIDYLHKHKLDPNLNPQTATSQAAYINAELDKEAYAHAKEFAYDQAIGKQTGSPLQTAFQHGVDAFKQKHPHATQAQLDAAGEKAIRDVIGKTTADGSSTGQTYEQIYANAFDSRSPSGSSGQSILELMANGKL